MSLLLLTKLLGYFFKPLRATIPKVQEIKLGVSSYIKSVMKVDCSTTYTVSKLAIKLENINMVI